MEKSGISGHQISLALVLLMIFGARAQAQDSAPSTPPPQVLCPEGFESETVFMATATGTKRFSYPCRTLYDRNWALLLQTSASPTNGKSSLRRNANPSGLGNATLLPEQVMFKVNEDFVNQMQFMTLLAVSYSASSNMATGYVVLQRNDNAPFTATNVFSVAEPMSTEYRLQLNGAPPIVYKHFSGNPHGPLFHDPFGQVYCCWFLLTTTRHRFRRLSGGRWRY